MCCCSDTCPSISCTSESTDAALGSSISATDASTSQSVVCRCCHSWLDISVGSLVLFPKCYILCVDGDSKPQSLYRTLCLDFNGHFPGGPGLASARMSPFWIALELRVMEVVSGDNWSYNTCDAPVKMSPPTN